MDVTDEVDFEPDYRELTISLADLLGASVDGEVHSQDSCPDPGSPTLGVLGHCLFRFGASQVATRSLSLKRPVLEDYPPPPTPS